MVLKKIKLKTKKFTKSHKVAVSILTGLSVIIITGLILIVFGVDQRFIKSPLSGKVVSDTGTPIADAEVIIQSQTMRSNGSGEFNFEDLRYGTYDIFIKKNGYSQYKERVKIKRFSTSVTVVLKKQDFGELSVLFSTDNTEARQLAVRINNQLFPVTNVEGGFVVHTGRLLTGNYLLDVKSEDYLDFQKRIQLEPGSAEETFKLFPAGDIVTEFEDYTSEKAIIPDKVLVKIGGTEKKLTQGELVENKLELENLDLALELEIVINKTGYLDKAIKILPKQGINSLRKIYLVPEDRVLFTRGPEILSTQVDGSVPKTLYRSEQNCTVLYVKKENYLIRCGMEVFVFIQQEREYRLLRDFVVNSEEFDMLLSAQSLVVVGSDTKEISIVHSANNSSVIYKHNQEIKSIITDFSDNIYFSDNDAVYRLDRQKNEAVEIIKGRYYLEDISPDSATILALSLKSSLENTMWAINTKTQQSNRLSFLPKNYHNLRFSSNNEYYYLDNGSLYRNNLDAESQQKLGDNIDHYWYRSSDTLVWIRRKQATGFIHTLNKSEKPLEIE